MFKNYIKTAARNLWRNKVFSFINIAGLSIGLACCMLIFLYTKDEVSFDKFHTQKNNIYRIVVTRTKPDGSVDKTTATGMMPGPRFKLSIPGIQDFVRVQKKSFNVKLSKEVFDQDALYVDPNFFSVFTFPLIEGNPKTVLTGKRSIVLSERVAEKYFGKTDALGKVLELNTGDEFEPFIVTGVAKNAPVNSSIQIGMLVPIKVEQEHWDNDEWVNFFLNTFVVLKPGTDTSAVEAKFDKVFNSEAALQLQELANDLGFKDKVKFKLQPLLNMHLSTDFPARNGLTDASNPVYSYILTGIALFILLIACINFINLTVAHSLKRAKEIGIRKVVGSVRRQLVIQFLSESFVLSFIAFVFAAVMVQLVLPFFNSVAGKALSFSYLFDAKLVAGYIILFIVAGVLAGFYPALVLSRFNPMQTLYGRFKTGGKNYLSKALVVLQFTLATSLIISTTIIYSQFNYLTNFDLGYNDKNVAVINTGQVFKDKMDDFRNELLKYPGIQNVTADQGGRQETIAHVNGEQEIGFNFRYVDENYFPLFQIPMAEGRNFSRSYPSDTSSSVVVNEAFVKEAGWKQPIGKQVDFFYQHKKYNVIGVIKDYHYASLSEKTGPQLFTTNPRYSFRSAFIKINPGEISGALQYIEKVFKNKFPLQPYQYDFADEQNTAQYNSEAKWKQIVTFGAILTIFISCIGLFGLATLSAERRKKEIGIRKVLGASVQGIVAKLSNDFLKLVLLSAVIAVPGAWWAMQKWLENYPYRIAIN
ncbi:MAG TPA: ABC transporter permease, partial [Chitinophagaceae bacterium]|nr:ABC transporter permease [Chitinophagaceae bacterium]